MSVVAFGNIPPFFTNGPLPTNAVTTAFAGGPWTFTRTAVASSAENIFTLKVSDDSVALFAIDNTGAVDGSFLPGLRFVAAGADRPCSFIAQGTADTGTSPLYQWQTRIGASTAVVTRPLFRLFNGGSNAVFEWLPLGSGANMALSWGTQAGANPAFTTRSAGTRLLLYSDIDGSSVDFAIGVNGAAAAGNLWQTVPQATDQYEFRRYGGTTVIETLRGDGRLQTTGGRVVKLRVATTTPVTGAVTDYVIGCKLAAPGAVAASIPGASTSGTEFLIKDLTGDAGVNNITITPTSGTIDGAATLVINANYGKTRVISDGTNYFTL